MEDLATLPKGLPVPANDGLADHLIGMHIPSVPLSSISGKIIDLSAIQGWHVIYCYPLTGRPESNLPDDWNSIPGARGCTPQTCSYRDYYHELLKLQAKVFGVSTQTSEYQREMAGRLHIPFEVLSDSQLKFAHALRLPTINVNGHWLIKRITLIAHYSVIRQVHYPVFPPDKDPEKVIEWLTINR